MINHKMSCLISEKDYEKLREIAYKERKTIGALIREAIEQYLTNREQPKRRPE